MTQFKFEGDLENLNKNQLHLVESALREQGFQDGNVIVEPVGQKGDNYVAYVKRFIYKINERSTFKMIGKIAPTAEQQRIMMNTMILFKNEITMYSKVLPRICDLQNLTGATENEKIRFPICYGILTEAPFELILLEDLKESGFEMLDRFKPLTNECVRLVIKDLAIFHSLSYALKTAEPETYTSFVNDLSNMWALMHGNPAVMQYFEMTENGIKSIMASDKYTNAINGTLAQISVLSKKLENYEKRSKYSVIQQGDCWNNNILFRLENGKPMQNVLIDYQLSKESNPAADILYMIFNCTDHATRLRHFQEWIDYYHEILDNTLANHGLKASRIYPREQLDADLRRYGKIMVGLGALLSYTIVQESKDAVDLREMTGTEESIEENMAKMQISSMNPLTAVKLKERIEGIVDTALVFGLV